LKLPSARTVLNVLLASVALAACLLLIVRSLPAQAATFNVTTTADTNDECDADCSLREAISAANFVGGANTIVLPAGTYTLALAGAGEEANATGDLDITSNITIEGAGADVTIIDAAGLDRVLDVRFGGSLSLSGVTVTGGGSFELLRDHGLARIRPQVRRWEVQQGREVCLLNAGRYDITKANVDLEGDLRSIEVGHEAHPDTAILLLVPDLLGANGVLQQAESVRPDFQLA